MNTKNILSILLILSCTIFAKDNISDLLSDLAQKSDLSQQTKKESAGFLYIYTRQDLDRMQIHSLGEIIEKIPFIRYNENNGGLTSPFYQPYQPDSPDSIRVYINDRELVTPFAGSALQLFGQMSMGYIDHVEIYMGVPSQTLGLQPAYITIKCYTKDPKREETNLIGTSIGSYGTKDIYGYSAKSLNDFSYMIYINNRNLGRKHIKYKENILSKDKDITNFYGEFRKNNLRFEIQASKGSMDNFAGSSPDMNPKSNYTDFDYFYAGLYYKNTDNGWKAFINFSQDKSDHYESSKTILGSMVIPVPFPPYVSIYNYQNSRSKLKEKISDLQIAKTFRFGKNKLTIGVQNRYKNFKFSEMTFGNISVSNSANYDTELIFSTFIEENYLIDESNLITAALKYNHISENGDVRNYKTLSGRLGYIYNNDKWTSKTFLFSGNSMPSMQTLFSNRVFYKQTSDVKKEELIAYGTKLIYKAKKYTTSLLLAQAIRKNSIYFYYDPISNTASYKNYAPSNTTDTLSYDFLYKFDSQNSIYFSAWAAASYDEGESFSDAFKYCGGMIKFLNNIGKFDFSNDIDYKHWNKINHDGWNFNSAITYHHSRKLTFYLKAENIFDKALKSNYYSYNPLTHTNNYLNDVDSIDRRIWLGLEYQF